MAEYEGLLAGLRVAAGLGIRRLLVLGDSQLVVNQVCKEYRCSDPQMDAYVRQCRDRENCLFPNASVSIPVPGKAGVHHTNMI